MDSSVVPYSAAAGGGGGRGGGGGGGGRKYLECMRNHAAAIGGQAHDGCGEFMPGGEGGTLEALKCAACGCHRNFHRREGSPVPPAAASPRPLLLPPPLSAGFPAFLQRPIPAPYNQIRPIQHEGGRAGSETPPRREEEGRRKRYRTRFTAEQKEKMLAFAERLGWRITKQDSVALQEFCVEVGVKRHVLKVWMHNNKHHLSSSTVAAEDTRHSPVASVTPISV